MEVLNIVADALLENRWGATVFVIVLATLLARAAAKVVFDRMARQLERTRNVYDDALLSAARKPLSWAIITFGLLFAAEVTGRGEESELFAYVDELRDVAAAWLLAWFAVRFVTVVEKHVTDPEKRQQPLDVTTAAVVAKLVRASILITAALMALQSLGFSIAGVLAFGGLGGLAVGFAARDMLANFFGALMIFLDRPFKVGDWVRSPDREIEGTVEEIGWRLTRIRTFDQRPLYVPNATFASLTVENPSRMSNRRIYEIVGVRYDDIGVLGDIVRDVREMLESHKDIDTERTLIVNLLNFGPSSLDIMIYTFTKTTAWVEFHAIKQDVLLRIADVVARHGAEIAFPTQTLHVGAAPDAEPSASREAS